MGVAVGLLGLAFAISAIVWAAVTMLNGVSPHWRERHTWGPVALVVAAAVCFVLQALRLGE